MQNNMTKYRSLFITLLSTLTLMITFAGCDKDKGAYYPTPSTFEVKQMSALELGKDKGTIAFEIKAGNLGWWIESDQDWIAPSKKYGSGDGKATLEYKANSEAAPRRATVTFHPTMGVKPVSFILTQK